MPGNPLPTTFDEFVDAYDSLIDWPKRLANEGPFFQSLFTEAGVQRVLDAGCGTGHHAAMFHRWGLVVEGADVSPAMIARCRSRFGEGERLRWTVRSFETLSNSSGGFDAVVCLGNSLALAADMGAMRRAVRSMIARLRPGGFCVLQVLNLWHVPEGPTIWQKCVERTRGDERRVLLKGLHRVGVRGYIDLIDLRMTPGALTKRFDSPSFMGIETDSLIAAIRSGGGRLERLHGGYHGESFEREHSADLICVLRS